MAGTSPRIARPVPAPQRRPVGRWLAYLAGILVLILLLGVVGGYVYARRSLPVVTGELTLPGLKAPVTVYRDERGVPHIEASSEHDLYMAQGYVTAQDRLFQMDLSRRAASGRLSEIVGEKALETDKLFRAIGLRRAAEESVKAYSPWVLELMDAYSAGVNAYMQEATASGKLPVEFALLGYKPEPWTPADGASIGKYMGDHLSRRMGDEVFMYELRRKVGPEWADQLRSTYPKDGLTTMKYAAAATEGRAQAALTEHVEADLDLSGLMALDIWPDPFIGSNNWVVAGSLTKSGKPLLANDPHLGISTPAIWHEVHLVLKTEKETRHAFGVMFPGAPGIIIGQTDRFAWGVTNTAPDVQDLFVEQRNPDNPYQFLYKDKYEDAKVIKELIPVKGKEPVPLEVVITRHGPIVSEVVGDPKSRPADALALQWTGHGPTTELEMVLSIPRANNWTEFREALKKFQVATQNFVFASVDGTIAYRANGLVPIRGKGNGTAPAPGWTGEYDWVGYIPFDEMPEVVNPKEGFVVTANHKVIDDRYPHFLTTHWAQPYRGMRITEMIEAKKGSLTLDDMQSMQVDYANLHARTLLPVLLPPVEKTSLNATELEALALLKGWNQVDSADQGAPLLFHLWIRELQKQLYEPKMGEELYKLMTDKGNVTDVALLEAADGRPNDWIKAAGGLDKLAVSSFQTAVAEAVTLQGKTPSKWAWGKYHSFTPKHNLGAAVKALGYIFNPTFRPVGGSGITVGAMSFNKEGQVTSSAPWRQVIDLADPTGSSRSIVTPGQGGHFLSPWYQDQAEKHIKGELFPRHFQGYTQGKKLTLTP